jgi:AcrR family transcriptional regulator
VSVRKKQAAATREQLLIAAREVFEERGYGATTVGAITSRADTAHGTFYLYFANKEDAFISVFNEFGAEMEAEAIAPWKADLRTGIVEGLRGFLHVYAAHAPLFRALLDGMTTNPRLEEVWLDLRGRFTSRIEGNLRTLVEAGSIRPLDPAMTAHVLGAMVEWSTVTHLVFGPGATEESLERLCLTLADLWLHAVYDVS